MSGAAAAWPIWLLATLCGVAAQAGKMALALCAGRRPAWPALFESVGFPSLHAAVLSCWTVLLGRRAGWDAPESSLALVCTTIVIHDSMRLKGSAQEQREALWRLVARLRADDRVRDRAAALRKVWAHDPLHVVSGVLFGILFALISGGSR